MREDTEKLRKKSELRLDKIARKEKVTLKDTLAEGLKNEPEDAFWRRIEDYGKPKTFIAGKDKEDYMGAAENIFDHPWEKTLPPEELARRLKINKEESVALLYCGGGGLAAALSSQAKCVVAADPELLPQTISALRACGVGIEELTALGDKEKLKSLEKEKRQTMPENLLFAEGSIRNIPLEEADVVFIHDIEDRVSLLPRHLYALEPIHHTKAGGRIIQTYKTKETVDSLVYDIYFPQENVSRGLLNGKPVVVAKVTAETKKKADLDRTIMEKIASGQGRLYIKNSLNITEKELEASINRLQKLGFDARPQPKNEPLTLEYTHTRALEFAKLLRESGFNQFKGNTKKDKKGRADTIINIRGVDRDLFLQALEGEVEKFITAGFLVEDATSERNGIRVEAGGKLHALVLKEISRIAKRGPGRLGGGEEGFTWHEISRRIDRTGKQHIDAIVVLHQLALKGILVKEEVGEHRVYMLPEDYETKVGMGKLLPEEKKVLIAVIKMEGLPVPRILLSGDIKEEVNGKK